VVDAATVKGCVCLLPLVMAGAGVSAAATAAALVAGALLAPVPDSALAMDCPQGKIVTLSTSGADVVTAAVDGIVGT
jgi:hypothetical protein